MARAPLVCDVVIAQFDSFVIGRKLDVQRIANHTNSMLGPEAIVLGSGAHSPSPVLDGIVRFAELYLPKPYLQTKPLALMDLRPEAVESDDASNSLIMALHHCGVGLAVSIICLHKPLAWLKLIDLLNAANGLRGGSDVHEIWRQSLQRIPSLHNTQLHGLGDDSYQAVFISDLGTKFHFPDEFVREYRDLLFEAIVSRPNSRQPYSKTRRESYVEQILGRQRSTRRHIAYYPTAERMVCLSTIKHTSGLYDYSFDWYLSYLTMILLTRLQNVIAQMVERSAIEAAELHGDLDKMVQLKRSALEGLLDYQNLQSVKGPRVQDFIQALREATGLTQLMVEMKSRIDALSDIVKDEWELRRRSEDIGASAALNLLALIAALPAASGLISLFTHSAPIWAHLLLWAAIVLCFQGIKAYVRRSSMA